MARRSRDLFFGKKVFDLGSAKPQSLIGRDDKVGMKPVKRSPQAKRRKSTPRREILPTYPTNLGRILLCGQDMVSDPQRGNGELLEASVLRGLPPELVPSSYGSGLPQLKGFEALTLAH